MKQLPLKIIAEAAPIIPKKGAYTGYCSRSFILSEILSLQCNWNGTSFQNGAIANHCQNTMAVLYRLSSLSCDIEAPDVSRLKASLPLVLAFQLTSLSLALLNNRFYYQNTSICYIFLNGFNTLSFNSFDQMCD